MRWFSLDYIMKYPYAYYLQIITVNYDWLDPCLGYVGSLTRR